MSFMDILCAVPIEKIIHMYPACHEMDILQFVDHMDKQIQALDGRTRLRKRRDLCGLSQAMLAEKAGVPVRQIPLFEQRRRNINNTSTMTLLKLSKAVHCCMEDLMENDPDQ